MYKLGRLLGLVAILGMLGTLQLGCQPTKTASATTPPVRDGVFIHLKSKDPHTALMALNMAVMWTADKDVLVYADIQAVHLFLKGAPDVTYSHFPSSHTNIKALLAKGVTIYVCPGCLKAAGKSGADLMPGVKVAQKQGFFGFTRGRILTLDY